MLMKDEVRNLIYALKDAALTLENLDSRAKKREEVSDDMESKYLEKLYKAEEASLSDEVMKNMYEMASLYNQTRRKNADIHEETDNAVYLMKKLLATLDTLESLVLEP